MPGVRWNPIRLVRSGFGSGDGAIVATKHRVCPVARLAGSDSPAGPVPMGCPGQTRCFVATIAPSPDPKPDLTNRIGFHRTPGIAYCYVLSGEIVFLVDTAEVKVRTGDLIVERNTDHSWRNETSSPVTMLITVVNAEA